MEIPFVSTPRKDTGLYNAKIGIWLFLASEVMLFGALFSSYIVLRVGASPGTWPVHLLNIPLGATNTIVLILSSVTVVLAWASLKMNQFGRFKLYQSITLLCALTFLVIKAFEYSDKFHHYQIVRKDGVVVDGHLVSKDAERVVIDGIEIPKGEPLYLAEPRPTPHREIEVKTSEIAKMGNLQPRQNNYMGIYFTLTGLHALHVVGGALVIGYLWGPGSRLWYKNPEQFTNRIEVSGLFWHFVDLVWIFLFPVLYLM